MNIDDFAFRIAVLFACMGAFGALLFVGEGLVRIFNLLDPRSPWRTNMPAPDRSCERTADQIDAEAQRAGRATGVREQGDGGVARHGPQP